ncbi:MAG: flagellar motor switch protein FliN [Planctomycetes bacterium]|nr:flagellar motor switch protein FliN [Planctomycetota bacterium]
MEPTSQTHPTCDPIVLEELEGSPQRASEGTSRALLDLERLLDLRVTVKVELASTRLAIADVLQLEPGSVLEFDREVREPVDILVGDMRLARGEIVQVGDRYGVRIVEIVEPEARVRFARA